MFFKRDFFYGSSIIIQTTVTSLFWLFFSFTNSGFFFKPEFVKIAKGVPQGLVLGSVLITLQRSAK